MICSHHQPHLGFAHHLRATPDAGKHRVDSLNERRPGWAQLRVPVVPAEDRTTTARRELPQSFSGHGTNPRSQQPYPLLQRQVAKCLIQWRQGRPVFEAPLAKASGFGGRRGIAIGFAGA